MSKPDTKSIARKAFAEIAARFPSLSTTEIADYPMDISIVIPVQAGLTHEVFLGLQNFDELHFGVGKFQLGWFPCTEPARVEVYLDAVTGYLSGKYRVVEHYRGSKYLKAQLQKPDADGWKTIGTRYSSLLALFLKTRTTNEIKNA